MGFGWLKPYFNKAQLVRTAMAARPTLRQAVHPHVDHPQLSVVIPCHNAAPWLTGLIWSIQSQDVDSLEILVVDDKSTDSSRRILAGLAQADRRIRVLDGPGEGPGVARNLAIEQATGQYLTFADADDIVLPGAYKAMLQTLQETGSDFVTGGYRRHRNQWVNRPRISRNVHAKDDLRVRPEDRPDVFEEPVLWNKMFRREFWDAFCGPIPAGVNYEDQPPIARAVAHASSIDVLAREVYSWRLSEEGQSRSGTKATLEDLQGRLAVTRLMWQIAQGLDEPTVAVRRALSQTMLRVWMQRDVAMYLPHFSRKPEGDPYRGLLREWARDLVAWAELYPQVWDTIDLDARLAIVLLSQGTDEQVLDLLGVQEEMGRIVPLDVRTGKIAAQYPVDLSGIEAGSGSVRADGHAADLLTPRPHDLQLQAELLSIDWLLGSDNPGSDNIATQDCALKVLVRMPGAEAPPSETLRLEIRSATTGELLEVAIEGAVDPSFDVRNVEQSPWWEQPALVMQFHCALPRQADPLSFHIVFEHPQDGLIAANLAEPGATGQPLVRVAPITLNEQFRSTASTGGAGMAALQSVAVEVGDCRELRVRRLSKASNAGTAAPSKLANPSGIAARVAQLAPQQLLGKPHVLQRAATMTIPQQHPLDLRRWEYRADGTAELRQYAARLIADTFHTEERSTTESYLVVTGRYRLPHAAAGSRKPQLWCISQANAVAATMDIQPPADGETDGTFIARIPAGQLRANSYFLRWSTIAGNRFTRLPVLTDATQVRNHQPQVCLGQHRSVRIEARELTTVIRPFAPKRIAEETAWETQQLSHGRTQPLRNMVYIESFEGKTIWESPGAILQTLLALQQQSAALHQTEFVIGVRQATQLSELPPGARPVVVGTDAWFEALTTATVLVTNNNLPYWFNLAQGQHWLQTWHGTPVKKLLFDAHPTFIGLGYRRLMLRQAQQWGVLLAQTPRAGELLAGSARYTGPVHIGEYPRNQRLVDMLNGGQQTRIELLDRMGIPHDGAGNTKPIILWAPTWRYGKQIEDFPAQGLAKDCDAIVLIRGHHMRSLQRKNRLRLPTIFGDAATIVDVSAVPRVEDCLAVADVLISDYSSIFFDYALLDRPSIVFAPDLEHYATAERGLYDNWPHSSGLPVVEHASELPAAVQQALRTPAAQQPGTEPTLPNPAVQQQAERIQATLDWCANWIIERLEP